MVTIMLKSYVKRNCSIRKIFL